MKLDGYTAPLEPQMLNYLDADVTLNWDYAASGSTTYPLTVKMTPLAGSWIGGGGKNYPGGAVVAIQAEQTDGQSGGASNGLIDTYILNFNAVTRDNSYGLTNNTYLWLSKMLSVLPFLVCL